MHLLIVNTLGTTVIAPGSVSSRFEDYAMVPLSTIAYAMTTFLPRISERACPHGCAGVFLQVFPFPLSMCWPLLGDAEVSASGRILGLFGTRAAIIRLGEAYLPYHELDLFAVRPDECDAGISGNGVSHPQPLYSSVVNISVRVASCAILAFYFSVGFLRLPMPC